MIEELTEALGERAGRRRAAVRAARAGARCGRRTVAGREVVYRRYPEGLERDVVRAREWEVLALGARLRACRWPSRWL